SGARAEERLRICALSGDPAWGHSVEQGPLEMFGRQAGETGEVTGAEASALPLARNVARIVAIPLTSEGTTRGVLLAGLPRGRTSLESLERLERRAMLSRQVLEQKERLSERARAEKWRLAMLECSDQPLVLLDRGGFLRGMSQGARKILSQDASVSFVRWEKLELRFVEMFRPREWERVSNWLQSGTGEASLQSATAPLNAQLRDGTGIRCRRSELTTSEFLAIAIERAAAEAGERRKEDVEAEFRQTVGW